MKTKLADDPLYYHAVEYAKTKGAVTAEDFQRHFHIGPIRARRFIDKMNGVSTRKKRRVAADDDQQATLEF
jgi:DNA segregation ATPase FtsK/SpoIIIE-like protein